MRQGKKGTGVTYGVSFLGQGGILERVVRTPWDGMLYLLCTTGRWPKIPVGRDPPVVVVPGSHTVPESL